MIACGKKEEVEVIPPYKIVVVRTCILKFLHSDPPVPLGPIWWNRAILLAQILRVPAGPQSGPKYKVGLGICLQVNIDGSKAWSRYLPY